MISRESSELTSI